MKKEQLLDAIGGVDESLLLETEQITRHHRPRLGRLALIAAIVAALAITVAANTDFFTGLLSREENGSSAANLSTGMAGFVYSDGYIYQGVPGYIYQWDTEGNKVKTYPLSDRYETPMYMFATEDAIVYVNHMGIAVDPGDELIDREENWGLRIQPKDGSAPYSICPGVEATRAYADGDWLYFNNGGTMLSRVNLVTREQTDLLENVYSYFVDDSYIYAIQNTQDQCIFRSGKDQIAFEQIPLDFDPNNIVADGEDLYLCQWLDEETQKETGYRYRVNLVRDGVTTELPIYSWFYQVLDGCVLYINDDEQLESYRMETGKTTTLAENVFEFSVLEDRYICIDHFNADSGLLDLQTGAYTTIDSWP